jgi:hypothetical protein
MTFDYLRRVAAMNIFVGKLPNKTEKVYASLNTYKRDVVPEPKSEPEDDILSSIPF